KLSAEVTHNHPQGIAGAESVAAAIFLLRTGENKADVRSYIAKSFGYDFSRSLAEIRKNYTFDISCQGSVPQAITAFWEAQSFEDCLRKAISIGGDSDTIAAIACSLAEACFPIPKDIITEALNRLDKEILEVYKEFLRRKK
ncbi:MAG: ADP-ribosylglycohydrolase family protein, partial [Bacillota bacterium]|nr:ADP-ribosylglycohydrolase family protein [Bacillota bacterium]